MNNTYIKSSKTVLVLFSLCLIYCTTDAQKDRNNYSFIGKRNYKTVKLSLRVDTVPSYAEESLYLMFDRNPHHGTFFSYEYGGKKKLMLYDHAINGKNTVSRTFDFNQNNGMYVGEIGKYRAFSGGRSVMLYDGNEKQKIDIENWEIYQIKNVGGDSVVFFGYNKQIKRLGLFKGKASSIIAGDTSSVSLVYDMHAENYGHISSAVFQCFLSVNNRELLCVFEKFNRILYLNDLNDKYSLFFTTLDTCEIVNPKKIDVKGKTGFYTPIRNCEFNLVNAFLLDDYIVTCPRKVLNKKEDLYPLDFYSKKTGAYLYSIGYGLPYKNDKLLLHVVNDSDKIVAVYCAESNKNQLLMASISKEELLKNIAPFKNESSK